MQPTCGHLGEIQTDTGDLNFKDLVENQYITELIGNDSG